MSLGRRIPPLHTSTMPDFTVGSAENTATNEHWVAKLFPPTYRDDLRPSSEDMKTILGNRLTAIDPEALRNIFHRVHALLAQQKEVIEAPKEENRREPRELLDEPPVPSVDESCIWDESEISVLRQAYKSIRDENRKLKNILEFTEQKLVSLDSQHTELKDRDEETSKNLSEARQANSRLQILTETLKRDIKSFETENMTSKNELESLKLERLDLLDKLKGCRIESDHDRMEKKRMQLEMNENGRTLLETAAHLETKLRLKYQREINELNVVIEELRGEFEAEKKVHSATRRGLDHLRTHFASMPLANSEAKDGISNLKSY